MIFSFIMSFFFFRGQDRNWTSGGGAFYCGLQFWRAYYDLYNFEFFSRKTTVARSVGLTQNPVHESVAAYG